MARHIGGKRRPLYSRHAWGRSLEKGAPLLVGKNQLSSAIKRGKATLIDTSRNITKIAWNGFIYVVVLKGRKIKTVITTYEEQ